MKKKQITAIILSAMMVISACMSSSSITAFAADNAITEETGVTEEEIESTTSEVNETDSEQEVLEMTEEEEDIISDTFDEEGLEDAENTNEADESISNTSVNSEETAVEYNLDEEDTLEAEEDLEEAAGSEMEQPVQRDIESDDENPPEDEGATLAITLDANGGFFKEEWDDIEDDYVYNATVLNKKIEQGEEGALYYIAPHISNTNLAFAGWSDERDGKILISRDSWTGLEEDCTLYAVWNKAHKVTFNANGGYFVGEWDDYEEKWVDETESFSMKVSEGDEIHTSIPENDNGLDFVGWSFKADGEIAVYGSNSFTPIGDCTLYAIWDNGDSIDNDDEYLVTLDANGGYFDFAYDVEKDEYVHDVETYVTRISSKEPDRLETPIPDDPYQKFLGWSTIRDGDVEIFEKYAPHMDITLYAVWGSSLKQLDAEKGGIIGDGFTWSINTDGVLTITGNGSMPDKPDHYHDGVEWWSGYEDYITSLIIEEGVTSVSNLAFYGCKLIKDVSLPSTLLKIGESAFSSCQSLKSIVIPEGVTDIGREAFGYCTQLKDVVLPTNLATLGVDAFRRTAWQMAMGDFPVYKGTLLRYQGSSATVEVPEGVKNIGFFAFEDTSIVKKVILPVGVERIEDCAFSWCFGLEEIIIPNTVTYIGKGAFEECFKMKSIVIPASVTSIGDSAFNNFPSSFVIIGRQGSYAEEYANSKGIIFEYLDAESIIGASVSVPDQTYTGKALLPSLTVEMSGRLLVKDTDYKVSYKNNTNAGKGTVIVEGIGDYTGSVTKTFTIKKAPNTITAKNFTKTYSTKAQTFDLGVKIKNGTPTYTSSTKSVTVSKAGKVTVKAKFIGKATITITAPEKTNYSKQTKKITITVNPTKTALSSVTSPSAGKMTVKWKKNAVGTGYQIQYSTSSKFTSSKAVSVTKNSTLTKTIGGLAKGKKYYVRIRTYKTVGKTKFYSAWSAAKTVTIKK